MNNFFILPWSLYYFFCVHQRLYYLINFIVLSQIIYQITCLYYGLLINWAIVTMGFIVLLLTILGDKIAHYLNILVTISQNKNTFGHIILLIHRKNKTLQYAQGIPNIHKNYVEYITYLKNEIKYGDLIVESIHRGLNLETQKTFTYNLKYKKLYIETYPLNDFILLDIYQGNSHIINMANYLEDSLCVINSQRDIIYSNKAFKALSMDIYGIKGHKTSLDHIFEDGSIFFQGNGYTKLKNQSPPKEYHWKSINIDENLKLLVIQERNKIEIPVLKNKIYDNLDYGILIINEKFKIILSNMKQFPQGENLYLMDIFKKNIGKLERFIASDLDKKSFLLHISQGELFSQGQENTNIFHGIYNKNTRIICEKYEKYNEKYVIIKIYDDTLLLQKEGELMHAQRLMTMGELLGGTIHEFNNLLTPLVMRVNSLLAKESLMDDSIESLTEILSSSEKLKSLVGHLLNMSKKSPVLYPVLDPNKILQRIVKDVELLIKCNINRKINIILHNRTPNLKPINIGITQFEQIIINLLLNSRDAILSKQTSLKEEGIIKISISKELKYTPHSSDKEYFCKIEIEDNGIGIKNNHKGKIFESYFTTKAANGVGLGLSMVKSILTNANGSIHCSSFENGGTKMTIHIPELHNTNGIELQEDYDKVIEKVIEEEKDEDCKIKVNKTQKNREIKICLLDDYQNFNKLLSDNLREYSYEVVSGTNGEELLQNILKNNFIPHILITDVSIPGTNIVEIIDKFTQISRNLQVIFISGSNLPKEISSQIKNKHEFLMKPFDTKDIVKIINDLYDNIVQ